ncbi:MAG: Uncharacterised protein [Prochlorococcus marinus str. MIT 9215]|nr:MAG: Uncharacterised protein [Prochlorococcus marinus str. MIT 9215]
MVPEGLEPWIWVCDRELWEKKYSVWHVDRLSSRGTPWLGWWPAAVLGNPAEYEDQLDCP